MSGSLGWFRPSPPLFLGTDRTLRKKVQVFSDGFIGFGMFWFNHVQNNRILKETQFFAFRSLRGDSQT